MSEITTRPVGRPKSALVAFRRRRTLQLWRAGLTREQIGKRLGVPVHTVSSDLRIMDAPPRPRPPKPRKGKRSRRVTKRRATVLDLWNSTTMTSSEIARELGVSQTTVTSDLHILRGRGESVKAGHERRRPRPKPNRHIGYAEIVETRRQIAVRMREDGALLREIADALGVHLLTVSRYLRTVKTRNRPVVTSTPHFAIRHSVKL